MVNYLPPAPPPGVTAAQVRDMLQQHLDLTRGIIRDTIRTELAATRDDPGRSEPT